MLCSSQWYHRTRSPKIPCIALPSLQTSSRLRFLPIHQGESGCKIELTLMYHNTKNCFHVISVYIFSLLFLISMSKLHHNIWNYLASWMKKDHVFKLYHVIYFTVNHATSFYWLAHCLSPCSLLHFVQPVCVASDWFQ